MGNALVTIPEGDVDVQRRIRTVRGVQVMLDRDLALLYEVETGQLNRHVKRNMDRFPSDFMFQLTKDDVENLKCQFGISSWGGDRAMQARQKALARSGRADVQRAVQELALGQGVRAIPRPLFHHRPKTLVHIGASLNYFGKKCFACSTFDPIDIPEMLAKLQM